MKNHDKNQQILNLQKPT